jgi:glutamyl-tRNA reductase
LGARRRRSSGWTITRARFEKLLRPRRYKPIFIIDIALPRDVEPSIEKLENVYLYNLDHLQQVVSATQSQRKESFDAARKIVTDQIHDFLSWHRQRQLGPLIDALYRRYHGVAREELARTLHKLPNVDEAEKAHLEELARRIVNKLLHDPIRMLRHSDPQHGPPAQYMHAMEKLFGLENPDDQTK